MTVCMLSNLDLRKAGEIGALVAASAKRWLQTPDGGVADLHVLKPSEPSELFISAREAESLIMTGMSTAADKCGIDDTEFEVAMGALDGFERGSIPYELVNKLPGREPEIFEAFRTARATLLKSREFQQGYRRVAAERERLKRQ
jgi:hypothetical protein